MPDPRLGLYEKAMPPQLALPRMLATAGEAGFDFVEMSIDESEARLARLSMGRRERRELIDAMDDTGIPFGSICLSGHRKFPMGSADDALRARAMEIMEGAVELAAGLGIRIVQLAGYDVYYEPSTDETRARFRAGLEAAALMAARRGVILAFETMETEFMDTVAKARSVVESVGSPWLQIYPDTGNITNAAQKYGTEPLLDLDSGRGHVVALHLKESLPGRYREVPFGSGHVDFDGCIDAVRAQGVGIFVAEAWHLGEADWFKRICDMNAFFRPRLKRTQAEE
jgi:predicted hexulose-6-phosphate isomerase